MKRYDVAVCGGGIAGIAAALASARQGRKTCLLEKEYALGGLATLGLIVIYLPLCDGAGVKMSAGLCEELLKLSVKYGPGEIPAPWRSEESSIEARAKERYRVEYNAASLIIAAEEALTESGVDLFYDTRITGAKTEGDRVTAVEYATKTGFDWIEAEAFVDCTGDADLCCFAGEPTLEDAQNRRTGWYYSYNGEKLTLHGLSDPLYSQIPEDSRTYSGVKTEDISQSMIDSRKMILKHVRSLHAQGDEKAYPLLIPTYHGLRMTRRLEGSFQFSSADHDGVWFSDAIGMIGDWRRANSRYSIPFRSIAGVKYHNLYAAGRCCAASLKGSDFMASGWDVTRVIPTCAVTGEAAGVAAALQSRDGCRPAVEKLQSTLKEAGVLLRPELFSRQL